MGKCKTSNISCYYLINPKDIKQTTTENGILNFEFKRKYGKFKREVVKIDFNNG